MSAAGKTDVELWEALANLDDDLLDAQMPEDLIDAEIRDSDWSPTHCWLKA